MSASKQRLAIGEALANFGHLFDEGDAEGWAAQFASGGGMEVGGNFINSPAGLAGMVNKINGEHQGRLRHSITNVMIDELGENTASARCYCMVTVWDTPPRLMGFNIYHVSLVKTDGRWLFERIRLRPPGQR
jgi:hypothetical protein